MKQTAKKPSLSPSRLDMLSRCGMQYYFRYVEGKIIRPGVAMVIGTATHKAIEANLRNKIETGSLLAEEAVAQTASEALKDTWLGDEPRLDEEEAKEGEAAVKGSAIDTAVSLSKAHHKVLAPTIKPIYVERGFRLELKSNPFDLTGYIDIQEADGIRDTKTVGKSPQGEEADKSVQLTAYALAAKINGGPDPAKVSLDYLVKTKEPKVLTLSSTRSTADYKGLLLRMERAAEVIEKGAFYPTSPDNWVCSARFCGYWESVCPHGKRSRTQA